MTARFFYTTDTPYAWSSGPKLNFWNERYESIADLAEAKELAERHDKGTPGTESYVVTAYGVLYE